MNQTFDHFRLGIYVLLTYGVCYLWLEPGNFCDRRQADIV